MRGGHCLLRHCEEPLRRSNPDFFRGGILDCFAALAMTTWRWRAQVSHRHPEVLATSASLEGRRPGCSSSFILRGSRRGAAHRATRASG
ncbi:hypothetical protein E4K64_19710 [Bradyrhizobium frederickii]|uniref:Uncharacterized protein n=1 Tax=Bradyrhizobium frederickii TaxID=2560054 RepID=A0A4Y9P494_9BRAD|nr:hypothetical protein E4K64_19710 [Bradyrhizobium frederickii]